MKHLPFDLGALWVFGKVVECRSISRAAQLLEMPKSTVSRQVSKLEADLGVKLLRKSTHQITVTDVGQQIYACSMTLAQQAHAVQAVVEGCREEPQGVLRVALPMFVGIDYAARVGTAFLQRFPKTQLDLQLVDRPAHPINDGFDIVLGTGPLQDSTLIAQKAFTLDCFLCAAPAFVRDTGTLITAPSQLNELPFIDSGLHDARRKLVLTKGRRSVELSPFVRAATNNFQVSKQYILQGLGIGVMPSRILCYDELEAGQLVPVLPEWSVAGVEVFLIYPYQLSFSNLIAAFHDVACQVIAENTARSQPHIAVARGQRRPRVGGPAA